MAEQQQQLTSLEVMTLTASAIKKVQSRGRRGLETVTDDEIVAVIGMVIDLSRGALEDALQPTADAADAARYRHLRETIVSGKVSSVFDLVAPLETVLTPEALDHAIDATMAGPTPSPSHPQRSGEPQ